MARNLEYLGRFPGIDVWVGGEKLIGCALWDWLKDADTRGIYPNHMHIVCMDRLHYPLREGIFTFESELLEIKAQIARRDLDALMSNESVAQYITWMREHRDIFEFVDSVGHYDSGWWLNSGWA